MTDLTEIGFNSKFSDCIQEYFIDNQPKSILETGLYHGMGSTRIIATLLKEIPIPNACFYSIECNNQNIDIARENLTREGLMRFVTIVSGLSIPVDLLPSQEEINKRIEIARSLGNIKLDHEQEPDKASFYYQKETQQYLREDVMSDILTSFNNRLDFALLDSGGHIGKIEFDYLISKLKYPCAIALDDTRHCKHFQSREMIQNDGRFEIINDNEEKYGSMLVKFNP